MNDPESSSRAELARVAAMLRGMLAETGEPDSQLTMSAATRHRLEGALLTLESLLAPVSPNDR